jgi:predicted phage terminase large subunit-like protein
LIAEALEKVERGEIERLIIEAPPRHGKSELCSTRFPAWFLGRNPTKQIICASYSGDLARGFGRSVRNIVDSQRYRAIFPDVSLAADSQASNRWHTKQGGIYVASGVEGTIAGRGADLFVIDDPLRGRAEADSETIRESLWRWYQGTVYTRQMFDAPSIIIMMTRYHEDDLVGRITELEDNGGDVWTRLHLPAIKEVGGTDYALWPDKFPVERLQRIKRNIGPREWTAQYQQMPRPDQGAYFQKSWFGSYPRESVPDVDTSLAIFGASDYALTADGGDYTVHCVFGVDARNDVWILDWYRSQVEALEGIEAWLLLCAKWKPLRWFDESIAITKSLGPLRERLKREHRVSCVHELIVPTNDKATRARSIQARSQQGAIHIPFYESWSSDLLNELLSFPTGKFDDQVDVLSLIGQGLDQLHGKLTVRPKVARGIGDPESILNLLEGNDTKGRYGRTSSKLPLPV